MVVVVVCLYRDWDRTRLFVAGGVPTSLPRGMLPRFFVGLRLNLEMVRIGREGGGGGGGGGWLWCGNLGKIASVDERKC